MVEDEDFIFNETFLRAIYLQFCLQLQKFYKIKFLKSSKKLRM